LVLVEDSGGCGSDAERGDLRDRHPFERVVARISSGDKPGWHGSADHREPQAPVRQGLCVVGDRRVIDRDAEPLGRRELGQLP